MYQKQPYTLLVEVKDMLVGAGSSCHSAAPLSVSFFSQRDSSSPVSFEDRKTLTLLGQNYVFFAKR
jgi:hypothetical protein